jgi:predicted nucleotidyltransferase
MSTGDAARRVGLSRQRIDQLARLRVFETELVGGRRLVHRPSLDAWNSSRRGRGASHRHNLVDLRLQRDEILRLAHRHRLSDVRVFGSVARGDAGASSDVDFLVHREPDATVLDIAEFAADLEDTLNCRVDVVVDAGSAPALVAIRSTAMPL